MRAEHSPAVPDTSAQGSLRQQEKRLVLPKAFQAKFPCCRAVNPTAAVIYSIQAAYCANGNTTLADVLGRVSYTFSTATVVLVWWIWKKILSPHWNCEDARTTQDDHINEIQCTFHVLEIKNISVSKILKFSLWCMHIIPTDPCDGIHAPVPIILARCSQWQDTEDKGNNKRDIIKAGKTYTRVSLKIRMLDEWKQKPFACGCLYYSTEKTSRKKRYLGCLGKTHSPYLLPEHTPSQLSLIFIQTLWFDLDKSFTPYGWCKLQFGFISCA